MMKNKKILIGLGLLIVILLIVAVLFSVLKAPSDKIEGLSKGLPEGWIYTIETSDLPTMFTGEKTKFIVKIEYPSVKCKREVRLEQQYVNVTPGIWLYFHDRWDNSKWESFNKSVSEIPPMATVAPPTLFAENSKYTILTYGGVSCPEKSIQEIETILKDYFKE